MSDDTELDKSFGVADLVGVGVDPGAYVGVTVGLGVNVAVGVELGSEEGVGVAVEEGVGVGEGVKLIVAVLDWALELRLSVTLR